MFIDFNEKNGNNDWRNSPTLGSLLDCVLSNSYNMISTIGEFGPACIGPVGAASMYGLANPFNDMVTMANLVALTLVAIFVVVLVVELMKAGASNIGQGKYLAFTFRVNKSTPFKVLNSILVVFVVLILMDTFRFLFYLHNLNGDFGFLVNFSEYLLPTLLTLSYSAYSLGSDNPDHFFDYDSEEFQNLQFERGWSELMTSNYAYADKLGIALLQEKRGKPKTLEAFIAGEGCSTLKEVVTACDKVSEKTPLV